MAGPLISVNLSADQLLGAKVSNTSGDTIGEIGDLMVDPNIQVTKAIVWVGGFLGIGSKKVVVDLSELN
jgi:sporulation protein YlmC with PRC-barrel domain